MSNPNPPVKSDNQKLIIGLIAGIVIGLLIGLYLLGYLPITLPIMMTASFTLLGLVLLGIILFTWFRDKLIKKIFGGSKPFDTILEEGQETINLVSDRAVDNLLLGADEAEKKKIKYFVPRIINYLLWSTFRNWGLRMLITIFAVIGGLLGTVLLYTQNQLLESQNEKIEYQVNLEEATRRSSLVFLMSNIMDKVDEELKNDYKNDSLRNLSPELIGRIAALSQSFKPYRYLIKDSLINKPKSPERGQLLLALINSKLDSFTYSKIYNTTTFSFAELSGSILIDADLRNAILTNADLSGAFMRNANLKLANLENANLTGANMMEINLESANLLNSNLSKTSLLRANMRGANLKMADLRKADLTRVDLRNSILTIENLKNDKIKVLRFDGNTAMDISNKSNEIVTRITNLEGAKVISEDWFQILEKRQVFGIKEIKNKYSLSKKRGKDSLGNEYFLIK